MLDDHAIMPTRAHEDDAGLDLYCIDGAVIAPGRYHVFDTGVHVEIPQGYAGLLVSKSGLNIMHGLTSTGLIDAGYTGSIHVALYNFGTWTYIVNPGDKISQLVLLPVARPVPIRVDQMTNTERGTSGFGSTGK